MRGAGGVRREAAIIGAGSQEHRQPLRRVDDGVVDLRQLARQAGLRGVRNEGGAEGGGDADEDERAEARGVRFRLQVETGGPEGRLQGMV